MNPKQIPSILALASLAWVGQAQIAQDRPDLCGSSGTVALPPGLSIVTTPGEGSSILTMADRNWTVHLPGVESQIRQVCPLASDRRSLILNRHHDPSSLAPNNGNIGIDSQGKGVAQLAEGRLGKTGQSINATINGTTTPWIWSVVEFDSAGNVVVPVDHAMFPTYSVYVNGNLAQTCPQSAPSSFIAQNQTYQRLPSQIPVSTGLTACHN